MCKTVSGIILDFLIFFICMIFIDENFIDNTMGLCSRQLYKQTIIRREKKVCCDPVTYKNVFYYFINRAS